MENSNVRILANYRRLKNIRRCNNFPTLNTENVAEHSFYVALTALTLADEYNYYANAHNNNYHPLDVDNIMDIVDMDKVLKRALFHDMEECFTSDIPYNVKHYSPELNKEIKRCISDTLDVVYTNSSLGVYTHRYYIEECKEGYEGEFVAIADLVEGAWYCFDELEMGNKSIRGLMVNYIYEIEKRESVELLKKTCPTLEAVLGLFKDALKSTSSGKAETKLFV